MMSKELQPLTEDVSGGVRLSAPHLPKAGAEGTGARMPRTAAAFILLTASLGATIVIHALLHWHATDPLRFICYLLVALLAAELKVVLPGIDAHMSVNFLFILIGMLELSLPETLVIGCM